MLDAKVDWAHPVCYFFLSLVTMVTWLWLHSLFLIVLHESEYSNSKINLSTLPQSGVLTTLWKKAFENSVGKGENAGIQHFLFYLQCFFLFPKHFQFLCRLYFIACKCFQSGLYFKFCSLGKGEVLTSQSQLLTTLKKASFENIVVTRIFSFSHNVFYQSQKEFLFLS